MKKIIYFCVAATVLLQACSTGKSFSKKRYGHLKWIDHNTQVEVPGHETPAVTPTEKTKQHEETAVIVPTQKTSELTPVANTQPTVIPLTTPVSNSTPVASSHQTTTKTDQPEVVNEPVKDINQETNTLQPATSVKNAAPAEKPMMDDTAKLIICVILAIFISPLGMYLWDQQTDVWFVVDLIFWLLWAFFIFGYGFGLLGLLAIVIALLRIFELL